MLETAEEREIRLTAWRAEVDKIAAAEKVIIDRVEAALAKKGVKLFVSACGCCEGATVSIEIDGETILDDHEHTHINMFKE